MSSMESGSCLFDAPLFEEGGFYLTLPDLAGPSNSSVQMNGSFVDSDSLKVPGLCKCMSVVCNCRTLEYSVRSESISKPGSKACREKLRRDKLNDRFLELGFVLEPGKPPKMDKVAILSDAVRMVTQLRDEAQKLKDSNESLQEKMKELKAEKNEFRDEKQRLKVVKENLEHQIKIFNSQPSYVPQPPVIPTAFATQGQAAGHKLLMPIIGYPGFPMWQFMLPADVDTSQDAESCPPVA